MAQSIPLLNHGFISLISSMGDDLSILQAAKQSYGQPPSPAPNYRLIHRLWRDRHTSPFEAVEFLFQVKAPIFVARQWMRHRSWSYNELSLRYKELDQPEFYIPEIDAIGTQSKTNKQGRTFDPTILDHNGLPPLSMEGWGLGMLKASYEKAWDTYRDLLYGGWPRELARMVLPLSTFTTFSAKVDLKNLLDFLRLRCAEDAQYEIRVYAKAILELIRPIVPHAIEAWEAAP